MSGYDLYTAESDNSSESVLNVKIYPDLPGMNFAADDSEGKLLFRDLFTNYLPAERPVLFQNQTINVLFEPVLIKVLGVVCHILFSVG